MTLKVGVVGAGSISSAHGEAWQQLGVELFVHSDEFADRFADRHGATVVAELDELLAQVDLVDIVTPTSSHAAIATRALEAGRDVICEKPLAATSAEAQALVDLAEAKGRHLYPAQVVRYFPQFAAAQQAVATGDVGRLAVQRFFRGGPFPQRPWFVDNAADASAVILDLMIHDLDQAVWLAGEVTSVFATAAVATEPHPLQTAHVVLTHANGVISHCRGLWGAPGLDFWYGFHIAGTTGMLKYDSRLETGFRLSGGAAGGPDLTVGPLIDSPYQAELADFVAAIQGGPQPRISAHDGVRAIELVEAAIESLRTGQRIVLTASKGN